MDFSPEELPYLSASQRNLYRGGDAGKLQGTWSPSVSCDDQNCFRTLAYVLVAKSLETGFMFLVCSAFPYYLSDPLETRLGVLRLHRTEPPSYKSPSSTGYSSPKPDIISQLEEESHAREEDGSAEVTCQGEQ